MEVIPKEDAKFLVALSKVGFGIGSIGILCGRPWLGMGVCIGSLIAQWYWSNPTYGYRRNIDLAWIQLLIWTHLWAVWGTPIFFQYVFVQVLGVVSYILSWILQKQNLTLYSVYFHGGVHLCSHISLLIFYLHPYFL